MKLNGNQQFDLSVITQLSEELFVLANELEVAELEKKIPEYQNEIEQQFNALDKEKLTDTDMDNLQALLLRHRELVELLNDKKNKISKELRKLHLGKAMQQAYPG